MKIKTIKGFVTFSKKKTIKGYLRRRFYKYESIPEKKSYQDKTIKEYLRRSSYKYESNEYGGRFREVSRYNGFTLVI